MVFHGCDVTKLPRTYVRVKLRRMRAALDELQGEIEMVSDNVESVHWGLVNKGGFSSFNDLYAAQRQSEYGTERTNLLASRAMGMLRYLNTVRQQNRGVFAGGGCRHGHGGRWRKPKWCRWSWNFTGSSSRMFWLNDCLSREAWADCEFPKALMQVLDIVTVNANQPVPHAGKIRLFISLVISLKLWLGGMEIAHQW